MGVCIKKSKITGSELLGYASIIPPPHAPVKQYSDVIDTKTAAIEASNAFPPSFKISIAVVAVLLCPAATLPYFISIKR